MENRIVVLVVDVEYIVDCVRVVPGMLVDFQIVVVVVLVGTEPPMMEVEVLVTRRVVVVVFVNGVVTVEVTVR